MLNETVKWFNAEKVLVSSQLKKVKTYSYTSHKSTNQASGFRREAKKYLSESLKALKVLKLKVT